MSSPEADGADTSAYTAVRARAIAEIRLANVGPILAKKASILFLAAINVALDSVIRHSNSSRFESRLRSRSARLAGEVIISTLTDGFYPCYCTDITTAEPCYARSDSHAVPGPNLRRRDEYCGIFQRSHSTRFPARDGVLSVTANETHALTGSLRPDTATRFSSQLFSNS